MPLFQAVYSSRPFGFDAQTLAAILLDARRLNKRDGITGALICRRDIYLQLLEGPEPAVRATLARIENDDRHVNVTLHIAQDVATRTFGDWDMYHSAIEAGLWSSTEVSRGAVDQASRDEFIALFKRLRATAA